MNEPDALLELRFLMLLGRAERALEVVEDRDELGDQPLVREPDVLMALSRRPLLVVLEVGGEAQQPVILGVRLLLLMLLLLLLLNVLLGHEVGASSSTTSYSPSSTTSSRASEDSPLSPPPADACACC